MDQATRWMNVALEQAARGVRGANPLVGAVIVDEHTGDVAVGHHRGRGTAHAEVDALRCARDRGLRLDAATMYVTLEPCNHYGVTPPCTDAILDAGIPRVVIAGEDPHDVAAGGAHTLRAAGVVVDIVPLDAAVSLNERWLIAQREHRPFIRAKIAQSLDGFSAALDGTSQWITGPQAREHAHKQRHLVDAIVVGTGTVLADQPTLTARYDPGGAQPLRVHMGHTTTPPDAPIRGADGRFVHLPTHDPNLAAHQLYERGARDILIEGGPRLIGAFLEAGLVDLLEVYTAPILLGGGTTSTALSSVASLGDALRFLPDPIAQPMRLGVDLLTHYIPHHDSDGQTNLVDAVNTQAVPGKDNTHV